MDPAKVFRALSNIAFRIATFPNDFVDEVILTENLVEHDFDVVAGVPVAVVIEAAGFLEHAVQLDATRAHVLDVSLGRFMPVFE